MKIVCIRSYSGPHFPAFGLNKVFSPNAGKCGPEYSEYGHFLHSGKEGSNTIYVLVSRQRKDLSAWKHFYSHGHVQSSEVALHR